MVRHARFRPTQANLIASKYNFALLNTVSVARLQPCQFLSFPLAQPRYITDLSNHFIYFHLENTTVALRHHIEAFHKFVIPSSLL